VTAAPGIDVTVSSPLWQASPALERLIRTAVAAAIEVAAMRLRPGAELSVILADDAHVRGLNAAWRGKDCATNVLSFPAMAGDPAQALLLGDIVLAHETIAREAADDGKRFDDHLAHLVVHGMLHLLGYDHLTDTEAEAMEGLERSALARLGIADPYAGTAPLAAGETV
jgi:probable rRNA maturation factor